MELIQCDRCLNVGHKHSGSRLRFDAVTIREKGQPVDWLPDLELDLCQNCVDSFMTWKSQATALEESNS